MNTKYIIVGTVIGGITIGALIFSTLESPPSVFTSETEISGNLLGDVQETDTNQKLAVIKDGVVINTILVPEGWPNVENAWELPTGTQGVLTNEVGIGDTFDGQKFAKVPPKPKLPELTIEELSQKKTLTEKEKDRLLKYLLEEQLKK